MLGSIHLPVLTTSSCFFRHKMHTHITWSYDCSGSTAQQKGKEEEEQICGLNNTLMACYRLTSQSQRSTMTENGVTRTEEELSARHTEHLERPKERERKPKERRSRRIRRRSRRHAIRFSMNQIKQNDDIK